MSRERATTGSPPGAGGGTAARAAWAVVACAVVVAVVPWFEQPGRGARELLLLLAAPAIPLLAGPLARDRVPRALFALLGLAAAAGAAGVLAAPAPERLLVVRDLVVLAVPWWFGWAAATAGPEGEGIDRSVGRGAAIALLAVAATGLAQAWLGWEGLPAARPPAGPFVNRNVAAQALVLLVPLAARAALAAPGLPERALGTAAAALGAALLVATRSRAAMVAAVAGGALAAVLAAIARRRAAERPARPAARRSRFAVALGAAVAAGAAAGALVPGAGASRLPSVTRSFALLAQGGGRSGEVRAALHANAMLLVARHPLIGAGPGRFPVVYPEVNRAVRETPDFGEAHVPESAHHDALQYAVELGVPAAWCLLAALGLGLAGLARRALLGPGRGNALAAAALAGALLHSLASFPLHSPASAWLAWFLAGRGWAAFVRPGAAGGSRWRARRAAALVLALLAFPLAWRDARAQAALARGWAAHGRGDCRAALREARAVVRSSLRHRDLVLAGQIAFDCERDPARSLALLERALAANPDQPNLLLATGARRLKAGRPEGARELFLRATAILPGSPRSWLGLAMAESRLGRTSEARRACERALSLPEALPAAEAFCRPLVGRGGTGSVSGGGTPPREPRAGPPACR